MSFTVGALQDSMPVSNVSLQQPQMHMDDNSTAMAMPIAQRKRKDCGADDDTSDALDGRDAPLERQFGIKNIRRAANMPGTTNALGNGDEEAQFHPLPPELNMQLLANLGYLNSNAMTTQQQPNAQAPGSVRTSHSPTSSFSDFGGPATPSDVVGSAESYFAKGMRRDSSAPFSNSAAYPDFKIYPDEQRVHTPGLLGMSMQSTPATEPDGMQMDGVASMPMVHGEHCKSIPQLHVRSEPGIYSELWAKCPDCGALSKIETPSMGDSLSYSP